MRKKKIIEKMKRDEKWLKNDIEQQKEGIEILEKAKENLDLKSIKNRKDMLLKMKLNDVRCDINTKKKEVGKKQIELNKIKLIRDKLEKNHEFFPDEKMYLQKNYA